MLSLLMLTLACNTPPSEEAPASPVTADAPAAAASAEQFGAAFTLTEVLPAQTLLRAPQDYVDQTVRVSGKVTDVCQKAGCWMVITDDQASMRVLMKDHAFSVSSELRGQNCEVEGQIVAKSVDPAFVAHMESESGDKENIPEKKVQGDVVYQLVATGVRRTDG